MRDTSTSWRVALALLCAIVILPVAASWADDDDDMDAAQAALAAGEIRPLDALLAKVERECHGRFVEMELERDDGLWIYEIKLLGPRGDVAELEYDARDFALVEAEGRRLDLLDCVPPGTPD